MITSFVIKNILAEELFGSRICESVEDHEIVEYFYKELLCEKFLYGEPITVPELRKILRQKILNFEFIKLNGEVRPARGTTMMKYIPHSDHPKGIRPSSPKVATFYDLDKMAWRSVSQRSKEIVLKKDVEKDRPVVVVRDKDKRAVKVSKEEPKPKVEEPIEEPIDELNVGDIRNYLNRRDENIVIEIVRISDEGEIFVKELKYGALFKVPSERIKNIGEKLTDGKEFDKAQYRKRTAIPIKPKEEIIKKEKPIKSNLPPISKEEETILLPLEQKPAKEPPKEIPTEPEEPGEEPEEPEELKPEK